MMHNNFMYQDPAEGPSILNVNASILEAKSSTEEFLQRLTVNHTTSVQHLMNYDGVDRL